MALKLDNNLLVEIGLGALPDDEKKSMLAHIYDTLETRVGMRLAEQMSDAQMQEFDQVASDEAQALKWLETTFPSYKEVVAEEFEKLKAEIAQVAPQIVAESQVARQGQAPDQSIQAEQPQYPAQQQPIQQQYPDQQPPAPQQ